MKEETNVTDRINNAPEIHENIKLLKSIENHNLVYSKELDWVGWVSKNIRTKEEITEEVKKNGVPLLAYSMTGITQRKLPYLQIAYDNYNEGKEKGYLEFEQYGRKFAVEEKYIKNIDVEKRSFCLDARVAKKLKVFEMELETKRNYVNIGSQVIENYCKKDLMEKVLEKERSLIKNKNPQLEEKILKAGCTILKEDENGFYVKKKNFVAHVPKGIMENKEEKIDGIIYSKGVLEMQYEKHGICVRNLSYKQIETDGISYKNDKEIVVIKKNKITYEIPASRIMNIEGSRAYILESELKKHNFETTGKEMVLGDKNMTLSINSVLANIQKEKEKGMKKEVRQEMKRGA